MITNPDSRAASRTRVRFVDDDSVFSFRLGRTPTFSAIASALGELAMRRWAAPRAIDVTFRAPSPVLSTATEMRHAR